MKRVSVYLDFADWWVGVYIGPNHLYICPLPMVVVRVVRATSRQGARHYSHGEAP